MDAADSTGAGRRDEGRQTSGPGGAGDAGKTKGATMILVIGSLALATYAVGYGLLRAAGGRLG